MELEYKIVQSTLPFIFGSRDRLEAVLAEEARAGWRLVEKFDDYRIRLQRDISARANDDKLDFDAYRTRVGVPVMITYTVTAVITVAVIYGVFITVGTF